MIASCTPRFCWPAAPSLCALLLLTLLAQNPTAAQNAYRTDDRGGAYAMPAARPATMPGVMPAARPPQYVAERSELPMPVAPAQLDAAKPNEHPLMPAIRWAREGMSNIEKIQDYSATLVKRERFSGKLSEYQYMFVKVRHKPFSVYMCFLAPSTEKGQEVIYVEGQNNGNMWAHGTGVKETVFGTVSLPPNGFYAMRGQRYPLTELGILNLIRRLVEVAEKDMNYGECEVKFIKGAKINDRVCTCIQVVHPVPRRNFLFNVARIFIDDELNVPVRYESYGWPKEAGGTPELDEEYTYLNLKLNNGFTDADFDIRNPNYKFAH
jgi:hypothetical protein